PTALIALVNPPCDLGELFGRQPLDRLLNLVETAHTPSLSSSVLPTAPAKLVNIGMASNALAGVNLSDLTEHRGVRGCLQWFTREKQWINEVPPHLCRIPAPTFLEQERAAWFADQFRSFGWNAAIDRAGNVLASSGDAPYIALTAHLDTVI